MKNLLETKHNIGNYSCSISRIQLISRKVRLRSKTPHTHKNITPNAQVLVHSFCYQTFSKLPLNTRNVLQAFNFKELKAKKAVTFWKYHLAKNGAIFFY